MSYYTLDFMAMDNPITESPILASHLKNVFFWLQGHQGSERLEIDLCKLTNTSGQRPKHSDGR